jgi:hypothetical protein
MSRAIASAPETSLASQQFTPTATTSWACIAMANASLSASPVRRAPSLTVRLIQVGMPIPSSSATRASISASRVIVSIASTSGPASASTRSLRRCQARSSATFSPSSPRYSEPSPSVAP